MSTLLLIDGNNLFYRAYHALPPLTDKSGENANAVYGFSNMLLKAIGEMNPTYVACTFDTKAPTFRHIEFEKYKAQRPAPPPDLYPQLPKVKKVLDAFGIPYFEKEGYEADDLLATLASKFQISNVKYQISNKKKKNPMNHKRSFSSNRPSIMNVVILSGDRDILQLVDGNIKVQMPGWNLSQTSLYGSAEIKEKFGLEPHQMVDYKSLIGDPSDNIPGVAGIGPKTASNLLQKYHTLENLFDHVKDCPLRIAEKLKVGRDIAFAAKRLVELDRDVDISFKLTELGFEPDWDRVRAEYERLGFKSIVSKLPRGKEEIRDKEPFDESQGKPEETKVQKTNNDQLKLI